MSWFKRITGIEAIEAKLQESIEAEERMQQRSEELRIQHLKLQEEIEKKTAEMEAANEAKEAAQEEERIAKLSPKDRATERGEPWVNVLDVKVNEENVKNGFFELDWNDLFIKDLIRAGYGLEADPEEEIVDRWFRDIVGQMLADDGHDPARSSGGYINSVPINSGRSSVS